VLSDVPAVVGELRAALDRLAALDPTDLADPSLLVGPSELFDVETVLRAVQTRWLAIADARETHRHDRDSTVSWGRLDSGLPAPPDTARRLACDAKLLPIVIDADGDVLRLGSATRTWSVGQRRSAWARDGGRRAFPRCRTFR